jgi:hypothetical protein
MLKKDRIFLKAVQYAIIDFEKGRIKRERFYFIVNQAGLFYKKSYPQVIHNTNLTKEK